MKRERDNSLDHDRPRDCTNRTAFRTSSESTFNSNPYDNNNNDRNKEHDRFLPIANVGRIMKKVIPGNGKISKDAKEAVQECVSEFISFVTGEASDKCQREKRKTINGDDILWAITTLEFENYVTPLKLYLNKFREIEGERLNIPRQHQQRVESCLDQQHNNNHNNFVYSSGNVYSSMNIMNQVSLMPDDPMAFSLPVSQGSMHAWWNIASPKSS